MAGGRASRSLPTPGLPGRRRKWARRGNSLAHTLLAAAEFFWSFLMTVSYFILDHVVVPTARGFRWLIGRMIAYAVRKNNERRGRPAGKGTPASETAPKQSRADAEQVQQRFFPQKLDSKTRFSDVIGLDDAKDEIRQAVILPLRNPKLARECCLRPECGVLLYGPPGTGKTELVKAIANEVDAELFIVTGEMLRNSIGASEREMSALFRDARRYPRSIIFFDECEHLLGRRRGGGGPA